MSRVHDHLLLPPLETPEPPRYRSDREALENAGRLYAHLRAKGYDEETAERLSMVGRLTGAVVTYSEEG